MENLKSLTNLSDGKKIGMSRIDVSILKAGISDREVPATPLALEFALGDTGPDSSTFIMAGDPAKAGTPGPRRFDVRTK